MNIGRLTGWTPNQVMWEIPFPALIQMLNTVEAPSDKEEEPKATPFAAAAMMGMTVADFTKEN